MAHTFEILRVFIFYDFDGSRLKQEITSVVKGLRRRESGWRVYIIYMNIYDVFVVHDFTMCRLYNRYLYDT